jgi:hypothetical protein
MRRSTHLTDEEKQNGKRAVLRPSEEIQKKMQPISREDFTRLVKKEDGEAMMTPDEIRQAAIQETAEEHNCPLVATRARVTYN